MANENLNDYGAVPKENRSNALVNKYKAMAENRRDYEELDISDCIPTLTEMIQDDMMYDMFEKAANGGTEADINKSIFYTQNPPNPLDLGNLGYYPEQKVFLLKANNISFGAEEIELNEMDGDTFSIPLKTLSAGGSFTIGDTTYNSFADYCEKKGLDSENLSIRMIGIDCPEIPHYSIQAMKETNIVSMTLKEARNKNAVTLKYDYDNGTVSDRDESTPIDLYKAADGSLFEIRGDGSSYIDNKTEGYVYKKIVKQDDSNKESLAAGYTAKQNTIDLLNGKSVYLMLDANGVTANKTTSKYKTRYSHIWNAHKAIGSMIDQWQDSINGTPVARLSYAPYGTDKYGRFIGAVYAPGPDGICINVAKYNIADDSTKSIANPDFTSSPELENIGSSNAAIFELYSYNPNNQVWLDTFSEMTKESYNDRIEFHKEVTGLDFTKLRNCTMMLGDTLMLIPPQNIRSLSSIEYEKVDIMRGKGSMVKNNTNRNMFLEVDLYFYNDAGVNGIKKDIVTPGGQDYTYYMNGLRSIISQFKIAPYLPIENQYINDVLGIEAVSLVNLHVSTVEGFPRLLQATLTLREFNYRIYMPDIPVDYSSQQESQLAEMDPIFAKCFHWEVFRYYYQRMINFGQELKNEYEYGTTEYNTYLYSRKEILQPIKFCDKSSNISFYVPDENWLKAALTVKKDRDYNGQPAAPVELTDPATNFIKSAGSVADKLKVNSTYAQRIADNCELELFGIPKDDVVTKKNILSDTAASNSMVKDFSNSNSTALWDLLMDIANNIASCAVLKYSKVDEKYNQKTQKLTWEIYFDVTSELGTEDLQTVKEKLKDLLGKSSSSDVLKDNKLIVSISTDITNNVKIGASMSISSPEITAMSKYSNDGVDPTSNAGEDYDYLNPAAMKFLPYVEDIELQHLSFSLSNNFSDINLKMMDGFAPQYMGASDITIEASFITNDMTTISMLNALPAHASNIGKIYRRILSCWPIKVRNQYLQLAGVNEVLIDVIEIQNVAGFPGNYEVSMRMTSVDRTMRQRETMRQLQSNEESSTLSTAGIRSYWDFDNSLATAELYPDLDLPSLSELSKAGYNFLRYKNSKQAYPDPDFYMTYAYPYTAYIIKKNLKDIFYETIFHDQDKDKSEILDETSFEFFDQMGGFMYRKLDKYGGTTEGSDSNGNSQNKIAEEEEKLIQSLDEAASDVIEKHSLRSLSQEKKASKDCLDLTDYLIYLTACDVLEGWQLKPGFTAPIVDPQTNLDVEKLECSGVSSPETPDDEKYDASSQEIFDIRAELIRAIDDYLSEEINYSKYRYNTNGVNEKNYYICAIMESVNQFLSEEKGKKIIQLLNPFEEKFKTSIGGFGDPSAEKNPEPDMGNFLSWLILTAARALSGKNIKDASVDDGVYFEAQQWQSDEHGNIIKDSKTGDYLPNVTVTNDGRSPELADSIDEALSNGFKFGMCQIMIYKAIDLKRIMMPSSKVTYLSEKEMSMYKDENGKERWHPGFIDPYYNIAGYKSQIGKEYIEEITKNPGVNAIAYLRIVLMHLRRMIIDGQIIGEADVIARDYDAIKNQAVYDISPEEQKAIEEANDDLPFWKKMMGFEVSDVELDENGNVIEEEESKESIVPQDPSNYGTTLNAPTYASVKQGNTEDASSRTEYAASKQGTNYVDTYSKLLGDEEKAKNLLALINNIPKTYARAFCSRLVLPFMQATTENDKDLSDIISSGNVDELNSLTANAVSNTTTTSPASKFCNAMMTTGMLDYDQDTSARETTSDSQKMWNYIMKEAYTKLADDPQAYILHSYYDMLTTDKRGRLLRAFPTYYVVFIDEGRKIGSWKLFDNFYNMSSISEITVSKSRKIPADTCTFVMSNMYTSYAAEYDNTTKQQYVDTYGLRDVFTSIFCPRAYFEKEDAIRRRKENTETVVLQAGIRIHVRMGYGSDASRLPIAFNGKIAEVDVADVVQVVAQGDGHELCNPLNALGEIDATSISEAQSWFTFMKDFRGSMLRSGETPRNLLAKLLTAQYGGLLKSVFRESSNDRFYGDSPFGFYHFGDKRFNDLFVEGEPVQNLYEVCDATLLKGVNELYAAAENTMISPTINTTIQDKTFWDLLHLSAYSGTTYMGAVRDFGFRSTVCLCKPNHYYAYAYKMLDNKIIEKRKPFQQYHYFDSYTDIVYNSIKASEKNMKTNAVGIWESTDMFWGTSQDTCGPIYLDINIYPEYQKSMTVDTMLVSDGCPGVDIPLATHFSEQWNLSSYDNKVNKSLAERITTNTLKESVSNMYCGELCVLGNVSIKPYDRFYINDYYEDMQGHMEVEGVVYSMNSSTGFTTTIYPDAIIRADDDHEGARHMINGTYVASGLVAGVGIRLGVMTQLASVDSKLIRALASVGKKTLTSVLDDAAVTTISNLLHIEKGIGLKTALKTILTGKGLLMTLGTSVVAAAAIYVCANNVRSFCTRWLRNIQALTVFPITKNGRPLLAGMAGHKGSVYGYPYTADDAKDSVQGLLGKVIDNISDWPLGSGEIIKDFFIDSGEYERLKEKWSITLPLEGEEPIEYHNAQNLTEEERIEYMKQDFYGSVNQEWRSKNQLIQALRTPYRINTLQVSKEDKTADTMYKRYHIDGIESTKELATDNRVLALYPIEDDIDIKQAVIEGSHPIVKILDIAHSVGNTKTNMNFESGKRVIKHFTVKGNEDATVYDLPMLQEDALIILKLILNEQSLKNKRVKFISGARINDVKTWKSTGFAFAIGGEDNGAVELAIQAVQKSTTWLNGNKDQHIFEYKAVSDGFLIIVYAPKDVYK